MINVSNKSNCCGCTACASICNHDAITMKPDELGFLYPSVDITKCVNCGLCEKVCQFHPGYKRYDNFEQPLAYSLRLKDEDQLMRSQSGGAFYAIADYILQTGGFVYGAAFNEQWRVVHQKASNHEELEMLRMTKYVQSDLRGVFVMVKKDLQNGSRVLFSGTSCQVASLKAYLPAKLHENLICVDIICHGVPSPKIWDDYVRFIELKCKGKATRVSFRDKRLGWNTNMHSFEVNGLVYFGQTSNYLYFRGYSIRESCSSCCFTNLQRVGDLTIGDFWGAEKFYNCNYLKKGISIILVNSEKGCEILESIKSKTIIQAHNVNDCLQPQLKEPTKLNLNRKAFIDDYTINGFEYVAKKYGDLGWNYKILTAKKYIKNILRLWKRITK